jgi:dephospho-CoA kinase
MIKIGITGMLSSGKSTTSKLLAGKQYPLFSADKVVRNLYEKDFFKKILIKEFTLNKKKNIKNQIKNLVIYDKRKIRKLEKIIHPLVRKDMKNFANKNRKIKILFFEIPLLIESKLSTFFNVVLFVNANKKLRLKRFIKNGGSPKVFKILNERQLSSQRKAKACNHVINNNKSLKLLKKNVKGFLINYE